jgi:hypothetical protein
MAKNQRPRSGRRKSALVPSASYAPSHNQVEEPTNQQIYDSRDDTAGNGAFGTQPFGAGPFGGGPIGGRPILGLKVTPLNEAPGPATRIISGEDPALVLGDKKPAPEPVGSRDQGFMLGDPERRIVLGDPETGMVLGQPPAPDPTVVDGPVVVNDRLEVRRDRRVTQAPPPPPTVRGGGVSFPFSKPATLDKAVVAVHVRALITVFDDVDRYDQRLHHNQPPPAFWTNDEEYLRDIKELVSELRRFNDLLEAENTKANAESIAKSGSLIGAMAAKACMAAATIVGASVAGLLVASVYSLLSYTDAGADVLQRLPLIGKGK